MSYETCKARLDAAGEIDTRNTTVFKLSVMDDPEPDAPAMLMIDAPLSVEAMQVWAHAPTDIAAMLRVVEVMRQYRALIESEIELEIEPPDDAVMEVFYEIYASLDAFELLP